MNGREIKAATVAVVVVFLLLGLRLWQLQVLKGAELRRLSEQNRLRVEKLPPPRGIIYDRKGRPLVKNSPFYSVALLPEMAQRADIPRLARFLGIPQEELRRKVRSGRGQLEPIRLKEGLSFQELAWYEARLSDYPELLIDVDITRHYLYGQAAAHLIGYIGELRASQLQEPLYRGLPMGTVVGQWGVERLYDPLLRGSPGKRFVEVDALGRELRVLKVQPPRKGQDIVLSLDMELQLAAEEAFGEHSGALVALEPSTGQVLALLSRPSFDPNLFSRGIRAEDWLRLSQDEAHPLFNRALQGQHPPGSVFKLVVAAAGLQEGLLEPQEEEKCLGGLWLGRRRFGCWKEQGHGKLDLYRAIVESCDVYFYQAGLKIGVDTIARYARGFGFGFQVGTGLAPEAPGLVPDTRWKLQRLGQPWYMGETLNTAIGQGYVLVSPLQMARFAAALAEGKGLRQVRFLKGEVGEVVRPLPISQETLQFIRQAMRGVVQDKRGTGRAAGVGGLSVAGKTGTAQVAAKEKEVKDHAWFVAFAPFEAPRIALAVVLEHGGHGGSAAAPVARKVIKQYLKGLEDANKSS
jgi:penicillin-binding protein 2